MEQPEVKNRIVYRLVLTGGPCGGKSTALENLSKYLQQHGYEVFCVPEVPTILMGGGCKYPGLSMENRDQLFAFEAQVIKLQLAIEDSFTGVAASLKKKSVIIHDRGLLDVKAYLPEDIWKKLLETNHWNENTFLNRYDQVIHLVTAADGAEKFYTTSNNAVRKESPKEAIELDNKVKACWKAHKHLSVIDNSGDFSQKLEKTRQSIAKLLNIN